MENYFGLNFKGVWTMKFEKGMQKPANSGRKKGTPNKKKLVRVSDLLADKEINPAGEILKLINTGTLEPKDELKAWSELLSYCQPKPRDEGPDDDGNDDDPDDGEEIPTADLISFVRRAKGTA